MKVLKVGRIDNYLFYRIRNYIEDGKNCASVSFMRKDYGHWNKIDFTYVEFEEFANLVQKIHEEVKKKIAEPVKEESYDE